MNRPPPNDDNTAGSFVHNRHRSGAPGVLLAGNAKHRADALGISRVLITFTHERTNAVAFAIAVIDG